MTRSLLLVEDDPVEAARLEAALSRKGFRVTPAADGDAALALLCAGAFDVVLLDMVVPGLDGMGVLAAMARRGIAVPVVVQVTAAGLDAAADAIRAGARDFVVKPAGALRLEVALANAIALGRLARTESVPVPVPVPAGPAPGGTIVPFPAPARPRVQAAGEAAVARLEDEGHVRRLEQIEAEAIRFALSLYGGRLAEAARRLGIGRSTLYRKLAEIESLAVGSDLSMEPEAPRVVAAE